MKWIQWSPNDEPLSLPACGALQATRHVFTEKMVNAINAALAAGRPLLIRGEPGTGKSQLARAAAVALGRAFLPFTVDARTEARDLRFSVDAVSRLADAQIFAARHGSDSKADARELLDEKNYTKPGPLWWAIHWQSARDQAKLAKCEEPWSDQDAEGGTVLLIDEIDKADPSVPNGLLEALGEGRFWAPGGTEVKPEGEQAPLVLITTNEEKALPDAFVRRCLVLQLKWPENDKEFQQALIDRGIAQFPEMDQDVMKAAAVMLAGDREKIKERGVCPPGGAEYLDLLRAVDFLCEGIEPEKKKDKQLEALQRVGEFALQKHPEEIGW